MGLGIEQTVLMGIGVDVKRDRWNGLCYSWRVFTNNRPFPDLFLFLSHLAWKWVTPQYRPIFPKPPFPCAICSEIKVARDSLMECMMEGRRKLVKASCTIRHGPILPSLELESVKLQVLQITVCMRGHTCFGTNEPLCIVPSVTNCV